MKKCIALLLAGLLLSLSGCASMLERTYTSSTTHQDYYSVAEDPSVLRAETYQGLVNSILYFVNEHSTQGTIRLYNYTGDVESDLSSACDEVRQEDPLGAFAVRSLTCEYTRILTYYEVSVRISYSRSSQVVSNIQSISGLSGLRQELSRTVTNLRTQTIVRAAYFSGDAQLIEDLFWLAYYSTPTIAALPDLTISLYPETGTQRIIEISVDWQSTAAEQADYARQLEETATLLLNAAPAAGESYTLPELAGLLRAVAVPDPEGESTALAALSGLPVNDTGLLLAMEFFCRQADVEVTAVSGTLEEEPVLWLIVATENGYRHLLPEALYPDPDLTAGDLALYTDDALILLGYAWPEGLHPVCTDYAGN